MVNWEFYKKDNSKEKLKWWMYIAIVFSFSLSIFLIYLYVDDHILSPIDDALQESQENIIRYDPNELFEDQRRRNWKYY